MNRDVRDQLNALRSELPKDDERQTVIASLLSDETRRGAEAGAAGPLVARPRVEISGVETWQYRPRRRSRARSAVMAGTGVAAAVLLGNVVVGAVSPSHARRPAGAAAGVVVAPAAPQAAPAGPAEYLKRGLPDPSLTPGERIPGTAPVLAPAAPLRDDAKAAALAAYGVSPDDRRYVVCRLIPDSLNGSSSPRNLFPTTPWFADLKARLDKALTQQVAQRQITPEQAEKELTSNWVQAMHDHRIRNYGAADASQAKRIEDNLRW